MLICYSIYNIRIKTSGFAPKFVGYNLLVLRYEAYRSGTQPHSLPTTKLGSIKIGSRKCWSYKNGTQGQEGSHVGILIPIPFLATLAPNAIFIEPRWSDGTQYKMKWRAKMKRLGRLRKTILGTSSLNIFLEHWRRILQKSFMTSWTQNSFPTKYIGILT